MELQELQELLELLLELQELLVCNSRICKPIPDLLVHLCNVLKHKSGKPVLPAAWTAWTATECPVPVVNSVMLNAADCVAELIVINSN